MATAGTVQQHREGWDNCVSPTTYPSPLSCISSSHSVPNHFTTASTSLTIQKLSIHLHPLPNPHQQTSFHPKYLHDRQIARPKRWITRIVQSEPNKTPQTMHDSFIAPSRSSEVHLSATRYPSLSPLRHSPANRLTLRPTRILANTGKHNTALTRWTDETARGARRHLRFTVHAFSIIDSVHVDKVYTVYYDR